MHTPKHGKNRCRTVQRLATAIGSQMRRNSPAYVVTQSPAPPRGGEILAAPISLRGYQIGVRSSETKAREVFSETAKPPPWPVHFLRKPAYHLPVPEIEDIPTLSEAELDALPQGIVRLDKSGKILYYSRAQAELAHRNVSATVGLNFFTEVAPCTAVRDFEGRFNDFVTKPEAKIESFEFDFRFPWGVKKVSITMVKQSGAESTMYIVVTTAESGAL